MSLENFKGIIVCAGDSYTMGDELGADSLVPGYTNYTWNCFDIRPNEFRKKLLTQYRQILTSFHKDGDKHGRWIEYKELCKSKAWPAKLGKLLPEYKIINIADPGISNDEIVHRSIETFIKLSETVDPEKIIFLIAPSLFDRFGIPCHSAEYAGEYHYQSFRLSDTVGDVHPYTTRPIFTYFQRDLTDEDHMVRNTLALLGINSFISNAGSTVVFLDSSLWDHAFNHVSTDNKKKLNLFKKILTPSVRMYDSNNRCLAGHHFDENTHDRFSKNVEEFLRKNRYLD